MSKRKMITPTAASSAHEVLGFDPQVSRDVAPHTLILGSCPSVQSLAKTQYYGHPQNAFWTIAGRCLGFERQTTPYRAQMEALLAAGFALWDVIARCTRTGSLDSAIVAPTSSGVLEVLQRNPSIDAIVFNSQQAATFFQQQHRLWCTGDGDTEGIRLRTGNERAERVFKRLLRDDDTSAVEDTATRTLSLFVLPSTSPAHATMSLDAKETEWRTVCYARQIKTERERKRQRTHTLTEGSP